MPNQKTTCSSGEAWPVFSRSVMNSRILSWLIFSASIFSQISIGVSAE